MKNRILILTILLAVVLTGCSLIAINGKSPEDIRQENPVVGDVETKAPAETAPAPTIPAKTTPVETPPSETETPAPEPEVPADTVLVFTGDIMPSDGVLGNYKNSGIDGVVDKGFQSELKNADITMINNEFPFSERGTKAPDKQFTFRIPPKNVSLLTDLGVDIVTLANNHSLDFGDEALLDTFTTLDEAGILYSGAGDSEERSRELQIIERNGKTFGFLSASRVIPVTSWNVKNHTPGVFTTYDPTDLLADIKDAKEKCDFLTVYVHWGIERAEYPEDYQRTMGKQYIDAGADLVVGSHPHVLQGFEYYNGKPIIYSLGNFIFNSSIKSTAALKVTVNTENQTELQLIAGAADNYKTNRMDETQSQKLFQYLEEISYDVNVDENGLLKEN